MKSESKTTGADRWLSAMVSQACLFSRTSQLLHIIQIHHTVTDSDEAQSMPVPRDTQAEEFVRLKDAARECGCSALTLWRNPQLEKLRVSPRVTVVRRSKLDRFLAEAATRGRVTSQSQPVTRRREWQRFMEQRAT